MKKSPSSSRCPSAQSKAASNMRANASRSVLPTIVERLSETAVSTPVTENDWFIIYG